MGVGGVVHHQIGDDAQAAIVRGVEEFLEVLHGAVRRKDAVEVGDVVAVVTQRRGIHRQDPQAVDAEVVQIVELAGEPREVTDAVAVGVHEGLHVHFVENRVLVPVAHDCSDDAACGSKRGWAVLDGRGCAPRLTVPTRGWRCAPRSSVPTRGSCCAPRLTVPTRGSRCAPRLTVPTRGSRCAPRSTVPTRGSRCAPRSSVPTLSLWLYSTV